MSGGRVTRRCIVRGKVQGVFFRASARDEARRLGVVGWARNLPDGAVEVVASGADERVQELIRWLWHGPPLAQVTDVEIDDVEIEVPDRFSTD